MHINGTSFGEVIIDGKRHGDVLLLGNRLVPRKRKLLERIFGTSHLVSAEEAQQLLSGNPEAIIIATGQSGALRVSNEIREKLSSKAQLIILETPTAIDEYNRLTAAGKRVNALIHTTC